MSPCVQPAPAAKPARTAAQIEAARRNGAKYRGPKTAAGKAISARNHTRHGMLSRNYRLLPEAGDAEFERRLQAFNAEYSPATPPERALVEQMALASWRSHALRVMETP